MAVVAPATAAQQAVVKKPEGFDLYSRFALAGALGCSVTHGAFTPVDVYVSIISGPSTIH
jgi:solute carrier family 25 phosphate transporter 3